MPRHYSESSADMAVHGRNVYDLIEKFKIINSKKEKVLYVCSTIQGFRGHGNHVNSAHADEFLNAVLPFMESNLDFANMHDEWISALVGIIGDHAASSSIDCIEEYSYRYHDSYEKAVFVVLTMVETSQVLKNFMSSLMRLGLTDILVEAFGAILVRDISYATQVSFKLYCTITKRHSQYRNFDLIRKLL